jgi:pimeloyl-ACP methyl ester carboxylesterase
MHDDDASGRRARQLDILREQARVERAFDHSRLRIARLPRCRSSLAYFELGDPEGTPLLCLHGLSVSGYFFEQYQAHFERHGIRAIAPCLLGGISVSESARTVDDLVDDLVELLDVLGIERVDLLGFSWGTLPQIALLARVPQRIRRAGLLGPMVPLRFLGPQDLERMKPDVRLSLRLAGSAPLLHRALMWSVCRLPVSALMRQFEDEHLSAAERRALVPTSTFSRTFAHCIRECIRTGSGFFTQGWRMFLDEPGYTLAGLAGVAAQVDVRFYVGEHDNVHLPAVAQLLAAACAPAAVDGAHPGEPQAPLQDEGGAAGVFQPMDAPGPARIWMAPGAGRMACILYLEEALDHLMSGSARVRPEPGLSASAPASGRAGRAARRPSGSAPAR